MTGVLGTGRQFVKSLAPAKVIQSRLHKKVIMDFAEKVGLVYFGYVDQRDDDHKLVRGLTLSAGHRDNHYCIGTYAGYDLTLVERTDTITFPGRPSKTHTWLIQAFDLHTSHDLPHIFVGLQSHHQTFYAHLFTKFPTLAHVSIGMNEGYDRSFTNKYAIYTPAAHMLEVKQLIDPQVSKIIGDYFGAMTCEIVDGVLYMYAEGQRPTPALLEKMLKYGTWLASVIDKKVKNI